MKHWLAWSLFTGYRTPNYNQIMPDALIISTTCSLDEEQKEEDTPILIPTIVHIGDERYSYRIPSLRYRIYLLSYPCSSDIQNA